MAKTNYTSAPSSAEAAVAWEEAHADHQSRLQNQLEAAAMIASKNRDETRQNEAEQTFYPFSRLPTEIQLLIWKEALENSYVLYKPTRTVRGGFQDIITKRKLCNRRWMGILLACRTSYEVGKNADRDVMVAGGKFRTWFTYWGSEKRWESRIRQEALKGNVVKRDSDVRLC